MPRHPSRLGVLADTLAEMIPTEPGRVMPPRDYTLLWIEACIAELYIFPMPGLTLFVNFKPAFHAKTSFNPLLIAIVFSGTGATLLY